MKAIKKATNLIKKGKFATATKDRIRPDAEIESQVVTPEQELSAAITVMALQNNLGNKPTSAVDHNVLPWGFVPKSGQKPKNPLGANAKEAEERRLMPPPAPRYNLRTAGLYEEKYGMNNEEIWKWLSAIPSNPDEVPGDLISEKRLEERARKVLYPKQSYTIG